MNIIKGNISPKISNKLSSSFFNNELKKSYIMIIHPK
jgi:hypothetical protein